MDDSSLRRHLTAFGQEHLLSFWHELTDDEKQQLTADLYTIDLDNVNQIFRQSTSPSADQVFDDALLEPLPSDVHESVSGCDADTLQAYRQEGTVPACHPIRVS